MQSSSYIVAHSYAHYTHYILYDLGPCAQRQRNASSLRPLASFHLPIHLDTPKGVQGATKDGARQGKGDTVEERRRAWEEKRHAGRKKNKRSEPEEE